jgi:hypothetical protein
VNPRAPRLARFGLALLSIALTFLGMFGWFSMRDALRAASWVDALVYGLVALAGFLGGLVCSIRLARSDYVRRQHRLKASIAAEPAFVGTRLEARASLAKVFGLAVAALLIGACGALIVVAEIYAVHRSVFGMFLAPVCLLSSACLGWMALKLRPFGRPTLVMDSDGLSHSLVGEVRWTDVIGIALQARSRGGAEFDLLVLGLATPGSVRQSTLARWLVPARKQMQVSAGGLDQAPARIHAAALALRDRVTPPRSKHWFPGVNPVLLGQLERQWAMLDRLDRIAAEAAPRSPAGATRGMEDAAEAERTTIARHDASEAFKNY